MRTEKYGVQLNILIDNSVATDDISISGDAAATYN